MSLPKVARITHEMVVPSTGKKVKFRPFLVKEEKVLILAQESGDQGEMARAIKEVISACVQTKGFSVDDLATFDLEYIFLNIRGRSVGEEVEVIITCPDDEKTTVPVTILLGDIKVITNEEHNKDIKLDDVLSLRMKYPTIEMVMESNIDTVGIEDSLGLICDCIDVIYSEEESWVGSDSTKAELMAWVEELEPKQFGAIEAFFTTMPKLSHTIKVTNPATGVESDIVLEGLGSFFA
jgi:hypothetical protein